MNNKLKILLIYILTVLIILKCDTVFAKSCDAEVNFNDRLSCLQKKYTNLSYKTLEGNNCKLTKDECSSSSTCTWLEKDSVELSGNKPCGIEYNPSASSYLCTYAADINGQGIYIELTINYNFFISANFFTNEHLYLNYRNDVKILEQIEGEDSALFAYDSEGKTLGHAFYCPQKIYFSTKSTPEISVVERHIYGSIYEATNYGNEKKEDLIEANILSDNTYKYMKYFEPNDIPETDIPVREPLTCEYENLTDGSLRISSITYVNSNTIIAEYIDNTGLVTDYNIDAIKSSEEFANWQCPKKNKIYVQVKEENSKLTAYIAYDKELLPDPDSSHEFEESGGSSNISDSIQDDVCQSMPTEITNYIKEALKLIRWLGLVLMIVLGTLDFVKAAAADDQDAMKKASQNFIKRLIAVIILFLLPILLELILYLAGLSGFVECYPSTDF